MVDARNIYLIMVNLLLAYCWFYCRGPGLAVVHFSAEWAEQCNQVTDVLKELAKILNVQSSGSKFGVCDAENLSEISLKYKVNVCHIAFSK